TAWDYPARVEQFCNWAERTAARTRFYNAPDLVRWNTNKSYLRDLAARGVPTIPTIWLERGSTVDLPSLLREHSWPRAFLKPIVGSTALHTLRFDGTAEGLSRAKDHLAQHLPRQSFLLQPYLDSVETFGE